MGWYTPNSNDFTQTKNIPLIKKQLELLWSTNCLKILLSDILKEINHNFERIEFVSPSSISGTNLFRRALDRSTKSHVTKSGKCWKKLDSPEVIQIAEVCNMYFYATTTLSQLRLDILSSLCFNNANRTLYDLWLLITQLGTNCGLKEFYEILKLNSQTDNPLIFMLIIFCDAMTHYVT